MKRYKTLSFITVPAESLFVLIKGRHRWIVPIALSKNAFACKWTNPSMHKRINRKKTLSRQTHLMLHYCKVVKSDSDRMANAIIELGLGMATIKKWRSRLHISPPTVNWFFKSNWVFPLPRISWYWKIEPIHHRSNRSSQFTGMQTVFHFYCVYDLHG